MAHRINGEPIPLTLSEIKKLQEGLTDAEAGIPFGFEGLVEKGFVVRVGAGEQREKPFQVDLRQPDPRLAKLPSSRKN